mgnify:CR=1 FL=1
MTVYEALKLYGAVIEKLEKAGVRLCDHKYLALFEDFRQAEQRGDNIGCAVTCLAERYGVSERTVYDVVRQMQSDCKGVSP